MRSRQKLIPSTEEIWAIIEAELKALNMSKYALSQESGVSQNQISRLSNGVGGARYETMAALAAAVGIEIKVEIRKVPKP